MTITQTAADKSQIKVFDYKMTNIDHKMTNIQIKFTSENYFQQFSQSHYILKIIFGICDMKQNTADSKQEYNVLHV